jgi:hypothetical protein
MSLALRFRSNAEHLYPVSIHDRHAFISQEVAADMASKEVTTTPGRETSPPVSPDSKAVFKILTNVPLAAPEPDALKATRHLRQQKFQAADLQQPENLAVFDLPFFTLGGQVAPGPVLRLRNAVHYSAHKPEASPVAVHSCNRNSCSSRKLKKTGKRPQQPT